MEEPKNNTTYHIPVLVNEVIEILKPQPHAWYLDATFGGGGHTTALLEAEPTCHVVALDWDTHALELNGPALEEKYGDRLTLLWGNFSQADRVLKKAGITEVAGILADFGTSQHQIFERPGFSFASDSPLDMRMSPSHQKHTAADIVNYASEKELKKILYEYGEESKAHALVEEIIGQRKTKKFKTTKDLADTIEKVFGKKRFGKIHPATKTFQALRIAVNHELDNITSFLHASMNLLVDQGVLACISFHSLEDRIVKDFFRQQVALNRGALLTPKSITADEQEIDRNPSSRSARLRALKYIKHI
jgi:16S rRNA (cytosine1402-N4)-methyltransferase